MTLCVLGRSEAEARKISIICPKSGDLLRYFSFQFAQSVPPGALLASSKTCMSLEPVSVLFHVDNSKSQGAARRLYEMYQGESYEEIVWIHK